MYKFELVSIDGTSTTEYDDLDLFAKEWMSGSLDTFLYSDRAITPDGITKIYPADDHTLTQLKKKAIMNTITGSEFSMPHVMTKTGVSHDVISELQAISRVEQLKGGYAETPQGRAFMIPIDSPEYAALSPSKKFLDKMELPQGSISLEDTLMITDRLANKAFVFDLRSEADSLQDILPRSLNQSLIVEVGYESNEGFNDDGIYADIKISGDRAKVQELGNTFKEMEAEDDRYITVIQGGYNNSPENPISKQRFIDIASSINPPPALMVKKDEMDNLESATPMLIFSVNNHILHAAGANSERLYVDFGDDGGVKFANKGQLMKMSNTTVGELSTISAVPSSEVTDYVRLSPNEAESFDRNYPF